MGQCGGDPALLLRCGALNLEHCTLLRTGERDPVLAVLIVKPQHGVIAVLRGEVNEGLSLHAQ